jgi:hypothetical protein
MIKANHSSTPRGQGGNAMGFTSREKSKGKSRNNGSSMDENADDERDENGNFKNWPVAGAVFD